MVDLRQVYSDLGYPDAATFIATGNVIFESDPPPDITRLETAFNDRFGFASEVFLRSEEEIGSILARVPWRDADAVVEVSFLETAPTAEAGTALEATAVAPEALAVSGAEVFFLREGAGMPTTHKESTSMKLLDMKMTRRGLATVRKIHDRFLADATMVDRTDANGGANP